MTSIFTTMSNQKAKVLLGLGTVMAMQNFYADDCMNMTVLGKASVMNVSLFPSNKAHLGC